MGTSWGTEPYYKKMNVPMLPMRFGTEYEYKLALTELKWIESRRKKLSKKDFETIAQKYHFPTDFLRKGLEGKFEPTDFYITKSPWFPIIYKWANDVDIAAHEFQRVVSERVRYQVIFLIGTFIALPYMSWILAMWLSSLRYDLSQIFLIGMIPLWLTFSALIYEINDARQLKQKEERNMAQRLMEREMESVIKVVYERYSSYKKWLSYRYAKKIPLSLVVLGWVKTERGWMPVALAENQNKAYYERVQDLLRH